MSIDLMGIPRLMAMTMIWSPLFFRSRFQIKLIYGGEQARRSRGESERDCELDDGSLVGEKVLDRHWLDLDAIVLHAESQDPAARSA